MFDSTPNLREVSVDDLASSSSAPAIAIDIDPTEWIAPTAESVAVAVAVDVDVSQSGGNDQSTVPETPQDAHPGDATHAAQPLEPVGAGKTFGTLMPVAKSPDLAVSDVSNSDGPTGFPVGAVPVGQVMDTPQAVDFSFVTRAGRPSFWHSAWVRFCLVMACVALGGLLFLQVVVQERDRIAAHDARARPAVMTLCQLLDCEIRPLRMIESISVESSSFNKLRADTFRLGFTLRNTGDIPIAQPAIELTLTDTQDTPLVRRVLLPADLDLKAEVLPAGAEQNGTYLVSVSAAAGVAGLARNIAGYRVLAFYP